MARRPRSETAASEAIRVRVTEAERADLQAVADELGQPMAAVIRDAVNEFVGDFRDRPVFRGP
jgi:predicted DNA-binding protein